VITAWTGADDDRVNLMFSQSLSPRKKR